MKKMLEKKLKGLNISRSAFMSKIADFRLSRSSLPQFSRLLSRYCSELGFDSVEVDNAGNIIATIKGYSNKKGMLLLAHMDLERPQNSVLAESKVVVSDTSMLDYKIGLLSAVYTGALLKRSFLPLQGDLKLCFSPRTECCDYGISYLFKHSLRKYINKIKGVILCEPTDFNIYLGHKGKMEYEIIVRGKLDSGFLPNQGVNMLSAMFPLINALGKVSKDLPLDQSLGGSSLNIKDVKFSGYKENLRNSPAEFKVVVNREFIPQEGVNYILKKAKNIAQQVYDGQGEIAVKTSVAKDKIRLFRGAELTSKKEYKPWSIDAASDLVISSEQVLRENGFKISKGYWKKHLTEGSYTYGELNLPTIGFGAGKENASGLNRYSLTVADLEKAVLGQTLIINRNIGMPAFGWSVDEI